MKSETDIMSEKNNKKDIESMSDHELLAELLRVNKRKQTATTLLSLLAVVVSVSVLIAMVVLIPRFMASMEQITLLAEQGSTSLEDLNKIDFDTLNQGIQDFSSIAAKLAKWFGK